MQELNRGLKDFHKLKTFFNENLGMIVDIAQKKRINIFECGYGSTFDDCCLDAQVAIYNAYNNCLNRANPSKGGTIVNVFWWELNKEFASYAKENAVLGYNIPSLYCSICSSTDVKAVKPYDFSVNDFESGQAITALLTALSIDGFTVHDIKSLNKLLMQPGLHKEIAEIKKDSISSRPNQKIIDKLWERYVSTKSKYLLVKLNRLALEDFYPETPKVQNAQERFVCSKCGLSVNQRKRDSFFVSYNAPLKQKWGADAGDKDLSLDETVEGGSIDVDAIIDALDVFKDDYYRDAPEDLSFSDVDYTVVVSSLAGKISLDSIKLINILSAKILPNGISREEYACLHLGCTKKELSRRRRSALSEIKKAGLILCRVSCMNGSIRKYILWVPRDADAENGDFLRQYGIKGTVLQVEKIAF